MRRIVIAAIVAAFATACVAPGPPTALALDRRAAGSFTGTSQLDPDSACMGAVYDMDVSPDVGASAQLHIDVCHAEELQGQQRFGGPFTYTLDGGELRGDAEGTQGTDLLLHITLQPTSGVGLWCDVRGTLTIDGSYTIGLPPSPPIFLTSGSLSADLDHDLSVDCEPNAG